MNFGPLEWAVIALIALLIFGHRLPGIARAMGASISEFKKGARSDEPVDK
jgi:sec-independent protein translocase protein TatA